VTTASGAGSGAPPAQSRILAGQALAACDSARGGAFCLALGICTAFLAPKLELIWLTRVAAMAMTAAAWFHGRSALLEMRFALTARACLRERWRAAVLPELDALRRLSRERLRAAVAACTLAGMIALLIFPIALAYALPSLLRIYAVVLALSAVRLPCMAMAQRRLLRELDARSRNVPNADRMAM